MLRGVRIGNGVGHADFRDFSQVIPNASSSTGSAVLLSDLDATLKAVRYRDPDGVLVRRQGGPFYEWPQMSPPVSPRAGRSPRSDPAGRTSVPRIHGLVPW